MDAILYLYLAENRELQLFQSVQLWMKSDRIFLITLICQVYVSDGTEQLIR